jgi:hypothetical protein
VPVQEGWTFGNASYSSSCIFCWDISYCVGSLLLQITICVSRMTCDTSMAFQSRNGVIIWRIWHIFCKVFVLLKGTL